MTASKWWLELRVHRRQQRADDGLSSPANRDAAADQTSCIYLPLSELKYPLIYMTWGCDISSIISSIISKRQCLHDGYGPPQWNWNVNAYWAAINTCNPTGPSGGGMHRKERPHKEGRSLQKYSVSVDGINSSINSKSFKTKQQTFTGIRVCALWLYFQCHECGHIDDCLHNSSVHSSVCLSRKGFSLREKRASSSLSAVKNWSRAER